MFDRRRRFGVVTCRRFATRPGNTPPAPPARWRVEPDEAAGIDPHAREARLARLEAVLLVADEPLSARRLADVASLADAGQAKALVARVKELYEAGGSAYQIEELAGGYQLLTRPRYHPRLTRLKRTGHEARLTPASLETLAVIAYKQPIMRAEVESIRGVVCAELIRHLMERGLVRVAGRHNSLGRPQLYGTTRRFLQVFGLNTLKDLPEVESLPNPG
jgi:segregation and condensation protein B